MSIVNGKDINLGTLSDAQLKEALSLDLVCIPNACMVCGKSSTDVDVLEVLMNGDSAGAREIIISGTHPKCWDEMFSGMEDEE